MMSVSSETTVSLQVGLPTTADPGAPAGAELPVLEARLGGAATGAPAVVAAPHPLMGGSLDNPVVEGLTQGLARTGCRTLRFNWRGVGHSTGTASGEADDARADYLAALSYAASLPAGGGAAGVVAAGYSFGSVAAVLAAVDLAEAARPASTPATGVSRLVLVAPPLAMVALPELERVRVPVHVLVGEHDQYAPVDRIRRRLAGLPAARLDVIAGADHFFSTTDPQRLASLVVEGAG